MQVQPNVYISPEGWASFMNAQLLASLTLPQADSAKNTQLGKRKGESSRRNSTARSPGTGNRYRGITHHSNTGRWESHIWRNASQVYLGGFYNDQQAALAYDLAAIRFRGWDAITNLDLGAFKQELDSLEEHSPEDIVMSLRNQSKTMNKVDGLRQQSTMQDWELEVSNAINAERPLLGVYPTEAEAARAYDKELVKKNGLQAHEQLNFKMADYAEMLDGASIIAGIQQGLIPTEAYNLQMMSPEASNLDYAEPPTKIARRSSVTPRSILEFEENNDVADDNM